MPATAIDTSYQVETPEGIDLHAQLAGPVPRILAYSIDIAIRSIVIGLISLLLFWIGDAGLGIILLLSFLLEWFYPVYFELYAKGQTPGKKSLGLLVVNDDLTPVNGSTSLIRNLLRVVDFLPMAYMGGIMAMCLNRHFQRMGDMAAGTLVIHQRVNQQSMDLPEVEACPPGVSLSLHEQVAIISFTQRHQQLSQSRQEELAAIVAPVLVSEQRPAVQTLQGIGSWLLGGKS